MSALTKIAVALLVIASLMLSAGVVVFVNKDEHWKASATSAEGIIDRNSTRGVSPSRATSVWRRGWRLPLPIKTR